MKRFCFVFYLILSVGISDNVMGADATTTNATGAAQPATQTAGTTQPAATNTTNAAQPATATAQSQPAATNATGGAQPVATVLPATTAALPVATGAMPANVMMLPSNAGNLQPLTLTPINATAATENKPAVPSMLDVNDEYTEIVKKIDRQMDEIISECSELKLKKPEILTGTPQNAQPVIVAQNQNTVAAAPVAGAESTANAAQPAQTTAATQNAGTATATAQNTTNATQPAQNNTVQNVSNAPRGTCFTKDVQGAKRFIPPQAKNERVYWWVGDSRFTGMYINGVIGKKSNEAVVAFAGRGLQWFSKKPAPTGISLLKSCLRDGDVVILGLGANDIKSYDSYISTYRQLMSEHPNVTFKVVSVNPVCDSKAKLKNSSIETFNAKLKAAFSANFVDTYSKLKPIVNEGNTDGEGLHYRGGGIEKLVYDTIMSN
ncbi:MAG: hypothetical protein IJY99_01255 [Alphaproteobacteria bacterium]|nr:hypothetical protein [Alphaproteobacteria bacterium]